MNENKPKIIASHIIAVFIIIITVNGCVTQGGGGWPVQDYAYACRLGSLPMEPICLISSSADGPFKYPAQFSACRQSISNYTNALDEYYSCANTKLKNIFDNLLETVPVKFNCYSKFFKNKNEGDPTASCPPLDVPNFMATYEADGLESYLGVPACIRKTDGFNFAPKRAYQLKECREQIEVFRGKKYGSSTFNAAPAQTQYDKYLRNLRQVIDQKAVDVVRKFNCYAKGQRFCS